MKRSIRAVLPAPEPPATTSTPVCPPKAIRQASCIRASSDRRPTNCPGHPSHPSITMTGYSSTFRVLTAAPPDKADAGGRCPIARGRPAPVGAAESGPSPDIECAICSGSVIGSGARHGGSVPAAPWLLAGQIRTFPAGITNRVPLEYGTDFPTGQAAQAARTSTAGTD